MKNLNFLILPLLFIFSACGNGVSSQPINAATVVTNGGVSQHVVLTWDETSAVDGYNIYRSLISGGPYVEIGSASTKTFSDTAVQNGTTYYYVVTSFIENPLAESAYSVQMAVFVPTP